MAIPAQIRLQCSKKPTGKKISMLEAQNIDNINFPHRVNFEYMRNEGCNKG